MDNRSRHANRHIANFLSLKASNNAIQVLTDGKELTAKNLVNGKLSLSTPILVEDKPTSIGMRVPKAKGGGALTVRDIADIIGHAHPVSVIDVQFQEELEGWTMGDLVDYFEDEQRAAQALSTRTTSSSPNNNRHRRAAATAALQKQRARAKVLNQISLEFSHTPLHPMVKSPQFVRDLDWIDHAWPPDRREAGDYPVVQYYCLTSTAGCYTDFHVDFGGTAVWYHVLRGEKTFALIEPTKENLAVYEDWLCRPDQAKLFFPDLIHGDVLTVTLKASQTLVIPTGWIHAVYTPVDSVVFGGNFLHGLDIFTMLEIYCLETRTRVPGRFRFPQFLPLMFYAGGMYLRKLQRNIFMCDRELEGLGDLIGALEGWWNLRADETLVIAAKHAARGCESVEEFLTLLKMERARRMLKDNGNEEKPKFRLKLPCARDAATTSDISVSPNVSPKHNSVQLTLSSPPDESKPNSLRMKLFPDWRTVPSEEEIDFCMSVPSSSHSAPTRKRKSINREDLDEYLPCPEDEEWQPDTERKRASQKVKAQTNQRPKSTVQPKKLSTTARQRLMKRFR